MEITLRNRPDGDADWYVQQVRDPEMLRFTTERESLTVGQAAQGEGRSRFVVVDAASGDRLANLAGDRRGNVAWVSYWVAPAARGQRVASQALQTFCRRVVDTWPVAEVRLWTHAQNVASRFARGPGQVW